MKARKTVLWKIGSLFSVVLFLTGTRSEQQWNKHLIAQNMTSFSNYGPEESFCASISNGRESSFSGLLEFKASYEYQNLFQTAGLNKGIRLEVSPSGHLSLVIGSRSNEIVTVLQVKEELHPWRDYKFEVSLKRDAVTLVLDNTISVSTKSPLDFECTEFIVGTGYDSSRHYKGRYTVTISSEVQNNRTRRLALLVTGISMIGFLFMIIKPANTEEEF